MRKTVLVTGGAGYIGGHACKLLSRHGYLPVAYDDLSRGHRDAVKWGPLVEGDINDRARLAQTFREHKPIAVMHFAALAYIGESAADPLRYYRTNVAGTLSLVETMRYAGVVLLVYSSSCTVYGVPRYTPVSEDHPLCPISPYGRTKAAAERILDDCAAAFGLRVAALRYFNACGADPDGEIGERHDPETHLIPRTIMAASGTLPELDVFGDDYPTPDGTCIRDYVHVSDLARAHLLALEHLMQGGASIKLNLGTGKGTSVREIVNAVERVSGRRVPVRITPRREGDAPAIYADPRKATQVLGFRTEFNDIEAIVETAWRFQARAPEQVA